MVCAVEGTIRADESTLAMGAPTSLPQGMSEGVMAAIELAKHVQMAKYGNFKELRKAQEEKTAEGEINRTADEAKHKAEKEKNDEEGRQKRVVIIQTEEELKERKEKELADKEDSVEVKEGEDTLGDCDAGAVKSAEEEGAAKAGEVEEAMKNGGEGTVGINQEGVPEENKKGGEADGQEETKGDLEEVKSKEMIAAEVECEKEIVAPIEGSEQTGGKFAERGIGWEGYVQAEEREDGIKKIQEESSEGDEREGVGRCEITPVDEAEGELWSEAEGKIFETEAVGERPSEINDSEGPQGKGLAHENAEAEGKEGDSPIDSAAVGHSSGNEDASAQAPGVSRMDERESAHVEATVHDAGIGGGDDLFGEGVDGGGGSEEQCNPPAGAEAPESTHDAQSSLADESLAVRGELDVSNVVGSEADVNSLDLRGAGNVSVSAGNVLESNDDEACGSRVGLFDERDIFKEPVRETSFDQSLEQGAEDLQVRVYVFVWVYACMVFVCLCSFVYLCLRIRVFASAGVSAHLYCRKVLFDSYIRIV